VTAYHPHREHLAEHGVAHSEREVTREIHRKARAAWQAVRCEFPRKVFSAEFRDGFIDGYSDYLDRGGDGQPPAAPPLRYTQNKKYFTPEGHALMRDYLLGFQYGTEVAVATGQRHYLTVPVLIPDGGAPLPIVAVSETGSTDAPAKPLPPPPQPLPAPKPMTKLPAPRALGQEPPPRSVVAPAPLKSGEPEETKFGTIPVKPDPLKLVPPLPTREDPLVPPLPGLSPLPPVPMVPLLPSGKANTTSEIVPVSGFKLPDPPKEVRDLPDDVPSPVILDLPDLPAPPVIHPEPAKK